MPKLNENYDLYHQVPDTEDIADAMKNLEEDDKQVIAYTIAVLNEEVRRLNEKYFKIRRENDCLYSLLMKEVKMRLIVEENDRDTADQDIYRKTFKKLKGEE